VHRDQVRELKKQMQENAERSFNREVLYEALTNLGFTLSRAGGPMR